MFNAGDKVRFIRNLRYAVTRCGQVMRVPYNSIGVVKEVTSNGFVKVVVGKVSVWITVKGSNAIVKI